MITAELAERFRNYVNAFGDGKRIVAIYLFGIEHGHGLAQLTSSDCKSLATKAGFKTSLGTELHKAIRLSPYVMRKPDQD